MKTMNHEQLRAALEAGGVTGMTLKAQGAAFYLSVQTRKEGEAVLVAPAGRHGQHLARAFADPREAVLLLRKIGIRELHLDATHWEPKEDEDGTNQPGIADAASGSDPINEYDKWFCAQVQLALDEAGGPKAEWVTHDEVKEDAAKQRAALLARMAKGIEILHVLHTAQKWP
jgi:hypothetical protein